MIGTDLKYYNKDIKNFTDDGKCSNCGGCCSDLLPLNDAEISAIKRYIKKHKIKESKHSSFMAKPRILDLTCPFRDNLNKKCTIYEVRPEICRSFICCKSQPTIEEEKRLCYQNRKPVSMREQFFNGIPLAEIYRIIIQLGGNDKL